MEALLRFYHVPCTVLDTIPTVSHLFFMRTLKVLVPILQVKKLRLRGVRQLAQTHPARRNWSQDSSLGLYASRFFLSLLSCCYRVWEERILRFVISPPPTIPLLCFLCTYLLWPCLLCFCLCPQLPVTDRWAGIVLL